MLFSKYYKCLWCVISTIRLVVEYTFIIKLFEYTNIIYVIGIYTQVIIVIFTNKVKTSNPCKTVYTPCTRSKRYTRPRRLSTVYHLGKHWIKVLKRVANLKNNINTLLTWIRSWLLEKSRKQAQDELDSARVQAIERAPTVQNSSKVFPHTLSLYF